MRTDGVDPDPVSGIGWSWSGCSALAGDYGRRLALECQGVGCSILASSARTACSDGAAVTTSTRAAVVDHRPDLGVP